MVIHQKKIIDLAEQMNLGSLSYREIGKRLDPKKPIHPQTVKNSLNHLIDSGYLIRSNDGKTIIPGSKVLFDTEVFINLPIVGSANCGKAKKVAEENIEGYLQVTKNVLTTKNIRSLFVIKAVGDSMNQAMNGRGIKDGDYVVVNCDKKNIEDLIGKYVLSVIGGCANIKKLHIDRENQQIVLISESTKDYPPIYIHEYDLQDYMINGEVVQVIRKPLLNS